MRKIKFRGMDINGNWYYGLLAYTESTTLLPGGKTGWFISNKSGSPWAYQVRPETIGQCTGLKDKNSRLIYEGDVILSNLDYGGTYFVIVGDVRGYCYDAVAVSEYKQHFANGKETGEGLSSTAYHIITDHGPCEVVGNIHENPELLEDK